MYADKDEKLVPVFKVRCAGVDCAQWSVLDGGSIGHCSRGEIGIDKDGYCLCFSNRTIKGHQDWSKNLNSDGTPKGGHVPDDYKVDPPGTVKSFRTHTRSVPEKGRK
jgi:hypothetical protein